MPGSEDLSGLLLPTADEAASAGVRKIDATLVRSPRRRSVAIHVDAFGKVQVRAPARATMADIAGFLERHRAWVLRKLAEVDANPPWQPHWGQGGDWYWRGEAVRLAAGGPRSGQLAGGVLALPLSAGHDASDWQRAVFRWHRKAAAGLLEQRASDLFDKHCGEHRLRGVELRWMRATWGTCSARRAPDGLRDVRLRLNPWLAALPASLCDAILLHELAHVAHMNHGPAFYRRLAALNPGWREHDAELKGWARLLFPIAAR